MTVGGGNGILEGCKAARLRADWLSRDGRHRGRALPARARAFSFVELIITIAILALLAGIAAPRVSNTLRRQRLDLASRRLMADLQVVRSQAIRDGVNRTLTLDLVGQTYSLPAEVRAGNSRHVALNVAPYNGVRLVHTSYNTAEVMFGRLGLPLAGGTITLQAGPEQVVISISSTSGRTTRAFGG